MATDSVSYKLTTFLWVAWTAIAIDHEDAARGARTRAAAATTRGDNPAESVPDEFRASLVAVTAASHAIDGLYGSIGPHVRRSLPQGLVDAWNKNGAPRHRRMLETFKLVFQLGPFAQTWPKEFKWLYGLRNPATHHVPVASDSSKHPLGLNMAPEYSLYTTEAAERAVDLTLDVLTVVVDDQRTKVPGAALTSHSADSFLERRKTLRNP